VTFHPCRSNKSKERLELTNIRVLIKGVTLALLLMAGFSFTASILLPQKNGTVEILVVLETCFGVGLLI
jgi:hypothetical protein